MSGFCVFCGIAERAEVLARDGGTVAIADINPVVPGHSLVIPARHVETYLDFSDEESSQAKNVAAELSQRLQADDPAIQGFNLLWNCGAAAWQTVPHAHMHMVPRRAGDDLLSALSRLPSLDG
ncbi:MAG: HIT family protein [Actinobacteria bacterium]|nr:HIT family protein [Actinomycetota bacterium]